MISEGSFNTEGWSNNAENYLQYFFIFQNITGLLYCIFYQINAAMVSIQVFFEKHETIFIIIYTGSVVYSSN